MITQPKRWHSHNLTQGSPTTTDFLNGLSWSLTRLINDGKHQLWAGDQLLASSDSAEEIDAFEFGMATALAVLPDYILEQVRNLGK